MTPENKLTFGQVPPQEAASRRRSGLSRKEPVPNEEVYGIYRLGRLVKVAPYLATARAAAIAIWGFRPRMVEKNRLIVGEERAKVLLEVESSGFIPVRGLVTQGRFLEARGVTEKWVYSPLKNLLVEADQQMPVSNFHLVGR